MQLLLLGVSCRALRGRSACCVFARSGSYVKRFDGTSTKSNKRNEAIDTLREDGDFSEAKRDNNVDTINAGEKERSKGKVFSSPSVKTAAVKKSKYEGDFQKSYLKFASEEMALLTDNEGSTEIIDAILKCPLSVNDWGKVTPEERTSLQKLFHAFSAKKEPSVTKILRDTAPPLNEILLHKWRKKKIAEMGEDGFKTYMTNITSEGTSFHKSIESYLGELPVKLKGSGQWESILPFLTNVTDVHCLECKVSHPLLLYCGRIDCVAKHKDVLYVVDWKLSVGKKETLKKCYDDPYQVAAYVGALNMSNEPSLQVSNAVIVKAYRDGSPADVHFLNPIVLEFYWEAWLRRLARHHVRLYNLLNGDPASGTLQ